MKEWGPKTQNAISRPIPTADDAVVREQDRILLQYAYSHQYQPLWWGYLVAALLKKLAFTFGPSLSRSSLRHATLAWAAAFKFASAKELGAVDDHVSIVRRELMKQTAET